MRWSPRFLLALLAVVALIGGGGSGCAKRPEPGTLVLLNGDIYTGESGFSEARAMVITGRTITAVCKTDDWAKRYIGKQTRVIDLEGKFVLPGLIDAHVQFAAAGAFLADADLRAVTDEEGLRREIIRAAGPLKEGEWTTGGGWGADEERARGNATDEATSAAAIWNPNRSMIDDLTPGRPCFLSRFDEKVWLANGAALKAAGLEKKRLPGLEFGPDGQLTGIVAKPSPAFEALQKARRPKSHQRLLDENRAALKALRESGITEIQDVSAPDQIDRFAELENNGELTCRVWLRPDLPMVTGLKAAGLTMGLHPKTKQKSYWLRYGALKGSIDGLMDTHGALLFDPYSDQPGNNGFWRSPTSGDPEQKTGDTEKLYGLIQTGLGAGFVPNIRAVGDRAVAETLDLFERIQKERQQPLKGFRIIQARLIRPEDFKRFRKLGLIVEINPFHLADDVRWIEERVGKDRARYADAFKSLLDNGALLTFGSDWPGTNDALGQLHPKYLIYAAVTRKTWDGRPEGGWFPEERISVKEAIKAYTINAAIAAFEDDVRGSLEANKLADVTIFDRNLLKIKPADILNAQVTHTIVDGRIMFEKR